MAYICEQLINVLDQNTIERLDNVLDILSEDGMKLRNYQLQTMEMCKTAIMQNWKAFEHVIYKNNEIVAFALDISPLISIFTNNISDDQYMEMVKKDGGYLSIIPYDKQTIELCMTALSNPIFTFNKQHLNLSFDLEYFDEYTVFGNKDDPYFEQNADEYEKEYYWYCCMVELKNEFKIKYEVGENINDIDVRLKFVNRDIKYLCKQIINNSFVKSARNKIDIQNE